MMNHSRTQNIILNSIFGIAASFVTVVLNFFVRVFIVKELGEEINGLQSLFYSITNVMLLMEMGISSAIVIHLYDPVAKQDKEAIASIMAFYKKTYNILAIAFTLISFIVTFTLLDHFVTSSIPTKQIRIFFILFTSSFTINYLTYYKRSLLFAEQKNRISITVTALCEIVFRGCQIIFLTIFHQYVIFLLLIIAEKITSNFICNKYVSIHHPYLDDNPKPIDEYKKKSIYATIKPLMVNQTANTVQQSAGNVLISILLGNISIVGYYGTYHLFMSVVQLIYSQFGGAFTTSFGNLAVEKDLCKMRRGYFKSAFIMNWMAALFCAGFLTCTSDLIYIVFGANFVLKIENVMIITMSMMVYLLNIPIISIQNALGLHRLDAVKMIIQTVLAIFLGYVGGRFLGMPGILGGLLLPMIIFSTIAKGIIICKHALCVSARQYLGFIFKEIVKIVVVCIICHFLCVYMRLTPSIPSIIIKVTICVIVAISIPYLLSIHTTELAETMDLFKMIINKKSSK